MATKTNREPILLEFLLICSVLRNILYQHDPYSLSPFDPHQRYVQTNTPKELHLFQLCQQLNKQERSNTGVLHTSMPHQTPYFTPYLTLGRHPNKPWPQEPVYLSMWYM